MAPQAYVTLLAGLLIVGFTAVALVRIIVHLTHVRKTLGTVTVGVRVISMQTAPVGAALDSVNKNLQPVRDFCESV
jgi:hypothetical protein